jgi:hypothetical protein
MDVAVGALPSRSLDDALTVFFSAILHQHAVVKHRIQGWLDRARMALTPRGIDTKHLLASPKQLRLDDSGCRNSPIPSKKQSRRVNLWIL